MAKEIQRKSWISKYKRYIYIVTGGLLTGLLAFLITINTYKIDNEMINDRMKDIADDKGNKIALIQDQSSVRMIADNETDSQLLDVEIDDEVSISEGNIEITEEKTNIKQEEYIPATTTPKSNLESEKKELTFSWPLEGNISMEYAKDKLIYSKTLDEWITHNGIDIEGEEASPVKAVADGKVKDIKLDPRYGNTIIIEHESGYVSIYSNLTTTDLVKINKTISKGDIISGVGKGYGFESEENPHVHYELLKDGNNVNPLDFLK